MATHAYSTKTPPIILQQANNTSGNRTIIQLPLNENMADHTEYPEVEPSTYSYYSTLRQRSLLRNWISWTQILSDYPFYDNTSP